MSTRSRQNDSGLIIDNPTDTTPDSTTPDTAPIPVQEGVIDFGANKPPQPYDGYLTAAFTDIEAFWKDQFPAVYGSEFPPLSGGIYAAYPERTEPIPGCGTPETSYVDVQGNAFYCIANDFMAYDDAELLPQLVNDLGESAVAVVLAHEFGHSVQARANEWDQPTILKEQQADCFAGAWAAHVSRGESDVISFTDKEIKGGLIAMIKVRDPVELGGTIDANSHGTGFDRVGAFQDGFLGGAERCKSFFTEGRENQLINIPFDPTDLNAGNLPLIDANPDPDIGPVDVQTSITKSLTDFWTTQLASANITLSAPALQIFDNASPPTCDGTDSSIFVENVAYCTANNTIYADQQWAESTIANSLLGDMAVGYLISQGYAEEVQSQLGSQLSGEPRALLDDCLTGAWAKAIVPDPNRQDQDIVLSAGDLDEAIITAIARGDETADTNVNGTAFEKVDAFRAGVLGGMQACQDRLTPP